MKKLTFLTAILLALPIIGFGQNVNIPDANFKAYLVNNTAINTNGDNQIQVSEASAFNGTIYCSSMNIYTLTGIEAFVSLTTLTCSENQLTSLDVSDNPVLTFLNCALNNLTSLDVSNCTALTTLLCLDNQLTSLDVSTCIALTTLDCINNQLTSLDVSTCTVLTYLFCDVNQLTSLNVSTCTALYILNCYDNQLTSLDVSTCTALNTLDCHNNQLTSLDVSACTALTYLNCSDNQLTSLNVKNGNNNPYMDLYAYNNPNLSCIEVDNVVLSTNNWLNNNWPIYSIDSTAFFSLNCSGAGISDINESNALMLYPNPTNGDFTITGLELVGSISSLILTDMNGKVVKVLDTKTTKFSMASIKPGVYFLNIISRNKQEVLKIVKE